MFPVTVVSTLPEDLGSSFPENKVSVFTKDTRSACPEDKCSGFTGDTSSEFLKETESTLPEGPVLFADVGSFFAGTIPSGCPADTGSAILTDTGPLSPVETGSFFPRNRGSPLPEDNVSVSPEATGSVIPEDAGFTFSEVTGATATEDTCFVLPDDPGGSSPENPGSALSGGFMSFPLGDTRSPSPVDSGYSLLEYMRFSFLGSILPEAIVSTFLKDPAFSPPGGTISTLLEHALSTVPKDPDSSFFGAEHSTLTPVSDAPFPQIRGSVFPTSMDSSFLKDPAPSFLEEVESSCFKELESIFSEDEGFLTSAAEGASTEDMGSGFPNKVVSEASEVKAPCALTVSGRGLQAKLPTGFSAQEAPSPAPLELLCLESMPRLWSRICLGGAGMAFGEEHRSLMTGPPVPRLPSCGEQRDHRGLESL